MDATMLASSVLSGVVSVPMDFYLGLERTFQDLNLSDGGRGIQSRNMHDDVRVGRAVYQAFRDRNKIAKIVNIIIDDSLQYLPEPALRKVYDKLIGNATSMTSRTATQLTLSSYLGSKVISGVMLSFISRVPLRGLTGGLTGGVIAQGVISRACEASRRLQIQNPGLCENCGLTTTTCSISCSKNPCKTSSKWVKCYVKTPQPPENLLMLSKLIRLLRKLIAEVSGGLVLMAMVVGIFLAATLNEGAMRIIAPLLVLVVGLVVYGLTWLIAEKPDRR
ncbi:hypothetical protein [Pantoea agglomerans]|nr:hypothetical protein [Pantoea agglomerans]